MKKKTTIFALLAALVFSLCGFAAALADTVGTQKVYVSGGGFRSSELESTAAGQTYADASGVANAMFLMNKPIGGTTGVNSEIVFDVEFAQASYTFQLGLSRKNASSEFADAESNYVFYYNNGTAQSPTSMVKGAWNHSATTEIAPLDGRVALKIELSAYGNVTLSIKIPETNTAMDETLARDSWITMYSNVNTSYPFLSFSNVDNPGAIKEVGYPYFSSSNFKLFGASVTPGSASNFAAFSEDFSDAASFPANWVANEAFDAALEAGTASVPSEGNVSLVDSQPNQAGVKGAGNVDGNNVATADNTVVSTQSFSGALRAEITVDTTGPCVIFGFLAGGESAPKDYIAMDFNGYGAFKDGAWLNGDYDESQWNGILNEDDSKFYISGKNTLFGGKMKFILDVSADGTTKLSLRVVKQTLGGTDAGLKTDADYVIGTFGGLFSRSTTESGKLFVACRESDWNHPTSLLSVKVANGGGTELLSDDFSYNNFNGNGLSLWTAGGANLTLPPLAETVFSGEGMLGVKKKIEDVNADILSGIFNFRLNSGTFGAAFALGNDYAYGAESSYLYFKQSGDDAVIGLRKGTAAGDERTIAGLDLAQSTLVSFRLLVVSGELEVNLGNQTERFELEHAEGYFGFFGEDGVSASLNHFSLRSNPVLAPEITLPQSSEGNLGETFDLTPGLTDASFGTEELTLTYAVTRNGTIVDVDDLAAFKPAEIGTYHIVYTVSNLAGKTAEASFDFEVVYGAPTVTVGDAKDCYNGLGAIEFAPETGDPFDETDALEVTMEVFAGKTAEGTALASNGLTFTPAGTGWYTAKFTVKNSHDLTATAEKTFRVIDLAQASDSSAAFDGSDRFESKNGTAANGTLALAADGLFGTSGWLRNYVQMVRITKIDAACNDIVLYFGRLGDADALSDACTLTFTRGSKLVTVHDGGEERTVDIGTDVFEAIGDGSLVIQVTMIGGKLELALMYGDLPYDVLNMPVAEFETDCPFPGRVGIATASGGVTIDRSVFVNYSDHSEIPDDTVPPDPVDPDDPVDPNDPNDPDDPKDPEKGCGGCGTIGFGGGTLGGGLLLLALAGIGAASFKKRIK